MEYKLVASMYVVDFAGHAASDGCTKEPRNELTWLSSTVLAAHSHKANLAVLVLANAIILREPTGAKLSNGDKERIANVPTKCWANELGTFDELRPRRIER